MLWRLVGDAAKAEEPRRELAVRLPALDAKLRRREFSKQGREMLAGHTHDLGKRGQRESSGAAIKPVVAVLPGDAVEDDRRELVRGNGQVASEDLP